MGPARPRAVAARRRRCRERRHGLAGPVPFGFLLGLLLSLAKLFAGHPHVAGKLRQLAAKDDDEKDDHQHDPQIGPEDVCDHAPKLLVVRSPQGCGRRELLECESLHPPGRRAIPGRLSTPTRPADLLECVINVSEGRDANFLAGLARAAGGCLLDLHSDGDHHRSVLTLAGPGPTGRRRRPIGRPTGSRYPRSQSPPGGPPPTRDPRRRALGVATRTGPWPTGRSSRPSRRGTGSPRWAGRSLGLPCFVYGPERSLPDVRRRAWRTLRPDAGPGQPHPTAGAAAVGARPVLVAYNLWLADPDLARAREIARDLCAARWSAPWRCGSATPCRCRATSSPRGRLGPRLPTMPSPVGPAWPGPSWSAWRRRRWCNASRPTAGGNSTSTRRQRSRPASNRRASTGEGLKRTGTRTSWRHPAARGRGGGGSCAARVHSGRPRYRTSRHWPRRTPDSPRERRSPDRPPWLRASTPLSLERRGRGQHPCSWPDAASCGPPSVTTSSTRSLTGTPLDRCPGRWQPSDYHRCNYNDVIFAPTPSMRKG